MTNVLKLQTLKTQQMADALGDLVMSTISTICPMTEGQGGTINFE